MATNYTEYLCSRKLNVGLEAEGMSCPDSAGGPAITLTQRAALDGVSGVWGTLYRGTRREILGLVSIATADASAIGSRKHAK